MDRLKVTATGEIETAPEVKRICGAGRLTCLDGLRGLAVLLVLVGHQWHTHIPAAIGVHTFFVLSGFLITRLLIIEEAKTRAIRLRWFYGRRFFRIVPAACLYLAAIAVLNVIGALDVPWTSVLGALFFCRNLFDADIETRHYWTLSIEEQFYCGWPFFLFLVKSHKARLVLTVVLMVLSPVWRQLNYKVFTAAAVCHSRLDLNYEFLLAGCLLAQMQTGRRLSMVCSRPVLHHPAVPLLVIGFLVLAHSSEWYTVVIPWKVVQIGRQGYESLAIGLAINYLVSGPRKWIRRLFEGRALVWLGSISYGLYLWQQLFYATSPGNTGNIVANLLLSIVCACASYYLLEVPMMRLRDRWFPNRLKLTDRVGDAGSVVAGAALAS